MNDPIKHVVLLLLENHSFDQMLGALQAVYPTLEGVFTADGKPRVNLDDRGVAIAQQPTRETDEARPSGLIASSRCWALPIIAPA